MRRKLLLLIFATVTIPAIIVQAIKLKSKQNIALNQASVSAMNVTANQKQTKDKGTKSCITRENILKNQATWGDQIVFIGEAYQNQGDFEAIAENLVNQLYAYDQGTVLFKPTKAAEREFRLTKPEAVSYFVKGVVPEDDGFAIQPWSKVRFVNAGMIINCDSAIAMGDYYFTDPKTNQEVKAEYTFAYQKYKNGKLLINLHHSSFPYEKKISYFEK